MNCRDFEPLLADLVGGELDEPGRRAVEEHLAGCAACRGEAAGLMHTAELLRALDTVSGAQAEARTRALVVVRRRSATMRLVYAGLRAAALIGLGVWLGWTTGAARPTAPPSRTGSTLVMQHADETGGLVHPSWRDRALEASPGRSSFARQLALIAHRRDR